MKIVACLQNAWFYPHVREEQITPRLWKYAFCRSRSGQRLRNALGKIFDDIIWENASPKIGRQSIAKFPADHAHIKEWLERHEPDIIIAFGRIAEEALVKLWDGDLIAAPHPASRLVTNNLLMGIGLIIDGNANSVDSYINQYGVRVALRQRRGHYEVEQLPVSALK